jgi:serine/threonine protein kinase
MELCPFGNLKNSILEQDHFEEGRAKYIFRQLIDALAYIHSMGVAHRDIKPDNILIDLAARIKLIDFGLSNYQGDVLLKTRVGSTYFAAPECFRSAGYHGFKSDVWSCGIVLYTMLVGRLPWTGHNEQQLLTQISKADIHIPDNLSEDAISLIQGILTADVENRFTIPQILSHKWLQGVQLPTETQLPHASSDHTLLSHSLPNSILLTGKEFTKGLASAGLTLIQQGRLQRNRHPERSALSSMTNVARLNRSSSVAGDCPPLPPLKWNR